MRWAIRLARVTKTSGFGAGLPGPCDNRPTRIDRWNADAQRPPMRKIRCVLGWHKFERRHNAQAGDSSPFYWVCAFCGRERDVPNTTSIPG